LTKWTSNEKGKRGTVGIASKMRSELRVESDVNDGKDTRWPSNVKGVIVKTN
jgi:hypothetical protein